MPFSPVIRTGASDFAARAISLRRRRIGHLEAAHGGTLFLDEIGDMPLAAQAKVLRALETHEITRVGGSKPISVAIRVVAATNADLGKMVKGSNAFEISLSFVRKKRVKTPEAEFVCPRL